MRQVYRHRAELISVAIWCLGFHVALALVLALTGIADGEILTRSYGSLFFQVLADVAVGVAFYRIAKASRRRWKWAIAALGAIPLQVCLFLWDIQILGETYVADYSADDVVRGLIYATVVLVPLTWLFTGQTKYARLHVARS